MQYEEAVSTLLNVNAVTGFMGVVIAVIVLFLLGGQAVKLWRELFSKPKQAEDAHFDQHVKDSHERFERGERHIAENHDNIMDLREGLRVSCIANIALLNHAIHNGNTDEMTHALMELNNYLINRK